MEVTLPGNLRCPTRVHDEYTNKWKFFLHKMTSDAHADTKKQPKTACIAEMFIPQSSYHKKNHIYIYINKSPSHPPGGLGV